MYLKTKKLNYTFCIDAKTTLFGVNIELFNP